MTARFCNAFALTFATLAAHGMAQAGPIAFSASTCHSGSISAPALTCVTKVTGVNYTATMSAWSAANNKVFVSGTIGNYGSSGVGILGKNEPSSNSQHAVDNKNGTDAFLISFGNANFALNQLSIGWRSGDADLSILRYTGAAAPALGSSTVASLDSAPGWEWVGDYAALGTSSSFNFNNSGTVKTASWWLVSAYNSAYSGITAAGNLSNGNDYFKLNGFGGEVVVTPPPSNQVPEPGTFALFGVALLGFAAARRKWRAK